MSKKTVFGGWQECYLHLKSSGNPEGLGIGEIRNTTKKIVKYVFEAGVSHAAGVAAGAIEKADPAPVNQRLKRSEKKQRCEPEHPVVVKTKAVSKEKKAKKEAKKEAFIGIDAASGSVSFTPQKDEEPNKKQVPTRPCKNCGKPIAISSKRATCRGGCK